MLVSALFLGAARADAPPPTEPPASKVAPTPTTSAKPKPPGPDYWLPALEIVGMNIGMNLAARALGEDFADISFQSVWDNLRGGWEWDDDYFTVNQLRHPYMGALFFTAARSARLGFWTSAAYTFAGSLMWEIFGENVPPAFNDQVSTSIGGVVLGESMHRLSQALRWNTSAWWTRTLAVLIDPFAAFNQRVLGYRQRISQPPPLFARLALGYNVFTTDKATDRPRRFDQLHIGLEASYGLPGDPAFVPRAPLDHFDIVAALDISEGKAVGSLFIRGLLWGRGIGGRQLRGLWGLFANYDYFSPDGIRVGAVGAGPGTTLQLRIGPKGFLQTTAVLGFAPVGAAGTSVEPDRDYHFGPGATQLFEMRLGRADTGMVRITSRNFQIKGEVLNEGSEVVSHTTLSGLLKIWGQHSVGVELGGSVRRARFEDTGLKRTDSGGYARVFYTITSDTSFGAVLAN